MATSQTALEKPLPNNLDAERSVLGAILLDNNALNAAIENLRAEDFFFDGGVEGIVVKENGAEDGAFGVEIIGEGLFESGLRGGHDGAFAIRFLFAYGNTSPSAAQRELHG